MLSWCSADAQLCISSFTMCGPPNCEVLATPMILQSANVAPMPKDSIQVVHVNNNHWIVASTLECDKADIIVAIWFTISTTMQVILAKLVNSKNDYFTIEARKVNTQSGTKDCGLFSAAYCTSLANGQDPSTICYDQGKMRNHLLKNVLMLCRWLSFLCWETVNIFCTCGCPDSGYVVTIVGCGITWLAFNNLVWIQNSGTVMCVTWWKCFIIYIWKYLKYN